MGEWTIYASDGQTVRAVARELEYHGEWMGDAYVTVDIRSAEPVELSVGDNLTYRGEVFEINYDPGFVKKARRGSYGEGFTYDKVKLYSIGARLRDCGFRDVVLNDMYDNANKLVYSMLGTFSFFAGSVEDLADRIQANLNRKFGSGQWRVYTPSSSRSAQRLGSSYDWGSYYTNPPASYGKTELNISVDDISCLDALKMAYTDFDLSFFLHGTDIVIGGKPVGTGYDFSYGKGNGLYEIERVSDDSQRIVTKLFAYGSDKNIPTNYYANLHKAAFVTGQKLVYEINYGQPIYSIYTAIYKGTVENLVTEGRDITISDGTNTINGWFDFMNEVENLQSDGTGWNLTYSGDMLLRLTIDYHDQGAAAFFANYTNGGKLYVSGVNVNTWPSDYVENTEQGQPNYPALLSINRLMLPGFPDTSLYAWVVADGATVLDASTGKATWKGYTAYFSKDKSDPWVMSVNSDSIGVREGTANFDSEDNDIYPTIEGTGFDEVNWAEQIDDNGYLDGEDDTFSLIPQTVNDSDGGIEWNYQGDTVSISMKDGYCVGREFTVKDARKNSDGLWELTLERKKDDSLGVYFPYQYGDGQSSRLYQITGRGNLQGQGTGDKFVVLGIPLPSSFVEAAAEKLLEEALKHLADTDHQKFTYLPKIDEIEMRRQHDAAVAAGTQSASVYNTISAGMQMHVEDDDLGIDYYPFIDTLTIKENGNGGLPTFEVVLKDEKEMSTLERMQSEVSGGTAAAISVAATAGEGRYLSRITDDTAKGIITLLKGLQVGDRFVSGLLGEGGVFRVDSDGTTYLEADRLYIRMKAYFDSVEIRSWQHSTGNRTASSAGAKCSRVEYIGSGGTVVDDPANAVRFRCYFRGHDGDDEVTNDFTVGDMAYCHVTNVASGSSMYNHHYWRLVTAKSTSPDNNNEHWIELSNNQSETLSIGGTSYTRNGYLSGSDVPAAQDDIVQLGNIANTSRQGAVIEYVTGSDSPSYQIYQGIGSDGPNPFTLTGKNYISMGYATGSTSIHGAGHAYLEVMGDFYFGDKNIQNPSTYIKYDSASKQLDIKANVKFVSPYTQQETNLDAFAAAVVSEMEDLQSQIDGEIYTWYYEGVPTLNNVPASSWTTDELKQQHIGDLYYDKDTGYAYRFLYDDDTQTYGWVEIHDDAIAEALRLANEAQDTADSKRRVFVSQPAPVSPKTYVEYDVGDLWVNATYPSGYSGATDESQHKYRNDCLRCITAKPIRNAQGDVTNGQFSINDWQLASKYTDDSALTDFVNNTYAPFTQGIQTQVDKKAETWYQDSDPSTAWTTNALKASHVGDIWCDTSQNGGHKTYIYTDNGSTASPRYAWSEQAVPTEVFDTIDGKAAIYVSWNAWDVTKDGVTTRMLQVRDLYIPSTSHYVGATHYEANKVYRCTAVGALSPSLVNPTFEEIAYTDDKTVNYIIEKYGQILNIQNPDGEDVGAALAYLRQVLGGSTSVDGGLILTNVIYMKGLNNTNVYAGISGTYQTQEMGTYYKGHGAAAWFGGGVFNGYAIDKEVQATSGVPNAAKILFRFDGSGYVAGGNISWQNDGTLTIKGNRVETTTLVIGETTVDLSKLVTTDTAQSISGLKTFANAIKIGDIYIGYDSTNNALKVYKMSGNTEVAAHLYALGGISAHGIGSNGGGGGGTVSLNEPLASINTAGLSAPSTAGVSVVWNGTTWKYSIDAPMVVGRLNSLDTITAYGNVISQYGGFKVNGKDDTYVLLAGGGTKPLSEIGGGGSGVFLPLAGGTMSDTAQIKRKGCTSSWILGRDNALIRMTPYVSGGYSPILSLKTTDGSWEMGSHEYGSFVNKLLFNYISDTDYANNTNQTTHQAYLDSSGRILTTGNYNGYALPLTGGTMSNTTVVTNLNADLLDGVHNGDLTTRYFKLVDTASSQHAIDANAIGGGIIYNYGGTGSGYCQNAPIGMSYGSILELAASGIAIKGQLAWDINHASTSSTRYLWWRASNNLGWHNDWKKIAFEWYNADTNGNGVDYNTISYNWDQMTFQPVHEPNYRNEGAVTQSNYPFTSYGTIINFSGLNSSFPFRIAVEYSNAWFYVQTAGYKPASTYSTYDYSSSPSGWKRLAFASELGNYLPLTGGTVTGVLTVSKQTTPPASSWSTQFIGKNGTDHVLADISHTNGHGIFIGSSKSDANTYFIYCMKGCTSLGGGGSDAFSVWANGATKIHGNISYGQYAMRIVNENSGYYAPSYECYFPNCSTTNWVSVIAAGKSNSQNNACTINFGYRGDQSTSNFVGIGFWGNDNILTVKADKSVTVTGQLVSSLDAGTAPLSVTSTTVCTNLNADMLDGQHIGYFAPASSLANFLPLTGGTMTGHITMGGQAIYFGKTGSNAIMSYSSTYPNYGIWYYDDSVDKMAFSASGNANNIATADLCLNGGGDGVVTIRGNKVWHEGNDGSDTGLDADLLDGVHASGLFTQLANYDGSILVTIGGTQKSLVVGYASSCQTATTASKLSTVSQTLFGNTYWTSGGVPTSIGTSATPAALSYVTSIDALLYFNTTNNCIGIGVAADASYKLKVNGYTSTTRLYLGSGVYMYYDSSNQAVKLEGAGFYTDSFISAHGAGNGSGGSSNLNQPLSGINSAGLGAPPTSGVTMVYNGTEWKYSSAATLLAAELFSTGASTVYGNFRMVSGNAAFGTAINSSYRMSIYGNTKIDGRLGIGMDVPAQTSSNAQIYLFVNGTVSAYGYQNASDMNLKDVVRYIDNLTTSRVAQAPIFEFTWKNSKDRNIHVGTSAQYWDAILPKVITKGADNILSMDYAATAIASVVSVARDVVEHDRKIKKLEAEIAALQAELDDLRA